MMQPSLIPRSLPAFNVNDGGKKLAKDLRNAAMTKISKESGKFGTRSDTVMSRPIHIC